jgi:hypothetical protein
MTVTALMIFMVISQICVLAYLLYSFNDVERGARKRMADLRAHIDSVCNDLEGRLREARDGGEATPRKRAAG